VEDPTTSVTPEQYAQAFASWHIDAPVPPVLDTTLTLPLTSLRSLGAIRRQIRGFFRMARPAGGGDGHGSTDPHSLDGAIDAAVMVIDEMMSNALRHAPGPSSLHVCSGDDRWIAIVSDGAPDRRPTPARSRPAGMGGYGLYLIADLSSAHGVHYEADRKLVWACIDMPF
jgi:hypothetical protein